MVTAIKSKYSTKAQELGISIELADPRFKKWELADILIDLCQSPKESGVVTFIARDNRGLVVTNTDFIVVWHDGLNYAIPDYKGRFSLKMFHVYNPIIENGPYW